jgi:ubiquinone/menaquinone biosynthesis C-methylase UbiE
MVAASLFSKAPMLSALKKRFFHNSFFAFNLVNRDRWVAEQAKQLPVGCKVLDVGAGSCPYRHLFDHCEYRTQDVALLDGEQLRHGGYGRIDYVGDATDIPAPDAEFDAVLCTEMLEHHPEPIRVVKELARILKPSGVLVLTAPLGSGIHQEPYHFYGGYTPYWYEKFLTEAGFVQISIEANEGFYRSFGQESLRYLQMSAPWRIPAVFLVRVLWAPLWFMLIPLLGLLMPTLGILIDRWDREKRFTVGYHVRAVRSGSLS